MTNDAKQRLDKIWQQTLPLVPLKYQNLVVTSLVFVSVLSIFNYEVAAVMAALTLLKQSTQLSTEPPTLLLQAQRQCLLIRQGQASAYHIHKIRCSFTWCHLVLRDPLSQRQSSFIFSLWQWSPEQQRRFRVLYHYLRQQGAHD
ncbi:hypothetical protein [Brackiella oedipodis]|uniref:hypothetical protein n=1 Tax=Brackiella oedipodis TaxID=124225 RepID=UPI00048F3AE4|nr:hypothetical protein [Brackiella oedipodis]